MQARLGVALLALGAVACGDPDTNDPRGYTKAPLENPGLVVAGEPATDMPDLGNPDLPRAEPLEPEAPAGGGGDGEAAEAPVDLASGVSQEMYDQGRELFSGTGGCTACHGAEGGGSQIAPSLSDAEWVHVPGPDLDALAEVIRTGVPEPQQFPAPMPPMGGASLSEDQVRALAGYVATIGQN